MLLYRPSINRIFFTFFLLCSLYSAVASAATADPPRMRLGDAIQPLAYDAALTIVPSADTFEGHIEIEINITTSQDFYWLNATDLDIKRATLTAGAQALDAQMVPGGEDFVGLKFPGNAPTGKAKLAIDYSGKVSKSETRGLFRQQENSEWYVFSQFEALHARRAFPCFDEPHWKTPWTLSLTVKREHVAVSNMEAVSEENVGADMKRVRFAKTLPLPTYLVALGVGPFDVVDGGVAGRNNTPLRYITPKGRGVEARYAAKITPQLLSHLEDYFGRPYPYSKLDSMVIPVTVTFGAMENAGLITYRSEIMLARPEREDERFQKRYASVGAHEIAHQWFGDLVTMTWWNDLWLNESFATWMARKTVEKFNPAWDAHSYRQWERHRAMEIDRLASTRQIRQPIESRDDLGSAFDGITYDKGGAVLTMFETWLGESGFRDGVRRYLNRHAFGNATAEDFFAALSESDPRLAKGFSSFVEQPGVPRVSMTLDCAAKPTLRMRQERFLPSAGDKQAKSQKWIVPICVRYPGQSPDKPFCTLLSEQQASVALPEAAACPAWLLPNPSGAGYYLTNLEPGLLTRLAQAPLKETEAASLLADISALAASASFPADRALELAAVYAGDSRPEVVKAAVDVVAGIHPALLDARDRERFAGWIRRHFGKRAAELGWLNREGDSDATRNLRSLLLPLVADTGRDPALRNSARESALQWLSGKDAPQPGAMLQPILRTAAYSGDAALFDALAGAVAKSHDQGERHEMYRALGAFSDEALREKSFNLFFAEHVDPREAVTIFWSASEERHSPSALQAFLRTRYDRVVAKLPEDYAAFIPRWGAAQCSTGERASFQAFYRERAAKRPGGARNLAQALESIDICVANRRVQQDGLKGFLSSQP
ncbi:MAG: hypothetical protein V7642_2704 [Burkholderiales bacterium]